MTLDQYNEAVKQIFAEQQTLAAGRYSKRWQAQPIR
jgi:hypothetical protein